MADVKEEEISLFRKFANTLAILEESSEWKVYKNLLESQIAVRKQKLVQVLRTKEDIAEHNEIVGEIEGLYLALKLPSQALASSKLDKDLEKFEKGEELNAN